MATKKKATKAKAKPKKKTGKLTEAQRNQIRGSKKSIAEIVAKYNISPSYADELKHNRTR